MNSIAVLGLSISLGFDINKIITPLSCFEAIKGRGMIYDLSIEGKFFQAIDESYNANPESTKSSINLLSEIDYLKSKRKILVLGDMMELGNFSKAMHIEMANFINNSDVNLVFCIGYETRNLWEYLNESKKGFYSNESEILIKSLFNKIKDNKLLVTSVKTKRASIRNPINPEETARLIKAVLPAWDENRLIEKLKKRSYVELACPPKPMISLTTCSADSDDPPDPSTEPPRSLTIIFAPLFANMKGIT